MAICISAVICTLDRADYLRKALNSLVSQSLPEDQYEVLVVDNGSLDTTKSIVCEEFKTFSNVRYLCEPALGLSRARNTGWRNAMGKYVAYLDDDAIASPKWLESILEVFETVKPQPGCVGGKVEPVWEAPRPPWLSDAMLPYVTVLSWSDIPGALGEGQWLAGANIAFPRHVLESVGGFNSTFGRSGSKLLSNEELLLERQLREKGYLCYYHPGISVAHHVPSYRLSKGWFFRRAYWQGISDALMRIQCEPLSTTQRISLGLRTFLNICLSRRQLFNLLRSTNHPDRFALQCTTLQRIGYTSGLFGIAR